MTARAMPAPRGNPLPALLACIVILTVGGMLIVAALPAPAPTTAVPRIELGVPIPLTDTHNPEHSPATSKSANTQVQNAIKFFDGNGNPLDPQKVICAILYANGEAKRALVWVYKYTSRKGQVFGDLQWFDRDGWQDAYPNKFLDKLENPPGDLPDAIVRIVGCNQLPPLPPLAAIQ